MNKESAEFSKIFSFFVLTVVVLFLFCAAKTTLINGATEQRKAVLGFRELLPTPVPYPRNKNIYPLSEITASSAIVIDADSLVALYEKNINFRLPIASLSKIMTALVSLENYRLDQNLRVNNTKVDGSLIKLVEGEEISVENLLYGLLVASGNDAAEILAENFPQGTAGFVWAMNQKAQELKLENTRFSNPIGFDEENQYSSAKDLARLTIFALKNPIFSKIVATEKIDISDTTGTIIHSLKNTNELMGKIEGVKGVKTGTTENAGECLVSLIERDGRRIVIVILGSKNRFEETKALINWVFDNFEWKSISF